MAGKTVQSVDDIQAESVVKDRTQFVFDIPKSMLKYGVEKVVVVEITTGEELMATKRARQDPIQLGFELAKESFRGVKFTGKRMKSINTGDGSVEEAYAGMHPKVRQLVMTAYAKLHNNTDTDQKDFLDSVQMTVA